MIRHAGLAYSLRMNMPDTHEMQNPLDLVYVGQGTSFRTVGLRQLIADRPSNHHLISNGFSWAIAQTDQRKGIKS